MLWLSVQLVNHHLLCLGALHSPFVLNFRKASRGTYACLLVGQKLFLFGSTGHDDNEMHCSPHFAASSSHMCRVFRACCHTVCIKYHSSFAIVSKDIQFVLLKTCSDLSPLVHVLDHAKQQLLMIKIHLHLSDRVC